MKLCSSLSSYVMVLADHFCYVLYVMYCFRALLYIKSFKADDAPALPSLFLRILNTGLQRQEGTTKAFTHLTLIS